MHGEEHGTEHMGDGSRRVCAGQRERLPEYELVGGGGEQGSQEGAGGERTVSSGQGRAGQKSTSMSIRYANGLKCECTSAVWEMEQMPGCYPG